MLVFLMGGQYSEKLHGGARFQGGICTRLFEQTLPLNFCFKVVCKGGGGGIFKRLQYNTIDMCRHSMQLHILTMWQRSFSFGSPGGGVGFSLNGITYQNNSLVTLEDIGEGDAALLCMTEYSTCCKQPARGNWFLPNGTRVPSSGQQWDFHRTRGNMTVSLHRRRGGEDGVYRCEVLDAMNITQTIYIGVYTADTGEQYINILQCLCCR